MRRLPTALGLLVAASSALASSPRASGCPCSDAALCKPLATPVLAEREVFVFSTAASNWPSYNWTMLTTIAVAGLGSFDPNMVCKAHAEGVRVVLLVDYAKDQLTNATARSAWIAQQTALLEQYALDGANIDFEDYIEAGSPEEAALTNLVTEATAAWKKANPFAQVTMDYAWSPNCIDERCFEYGAMARVLDAVFVMDYDMRSQVFPPDPCLASANSPLPLLEAGMRNFTALGVPPSKLILGVPWYGYTYTCVGDVAPDAALCPIAHTVWRNATCSDAVGSEICYADLLPLLANNATRPRTWNETLAAPFFNYVDSTTHAVHQVWYDDPESIALKVAFADSLRLRGVGMWEVDCVDYSDTPSAIALRAAMYAALAKAE